MDTWTSCDLFVTIATVLSTMLFEQQLVSRLSLSKVLKCKNLFNRLVRFYHVLVPRQTPPAARRLHYEDETRNRPLRFSRRTLKRGKRGRWRWHLSQRYLEQLNKKWNDRYAEETRYKAFVVYENETNPDENPGDLFSQWLEQRSAVKWSENHEVRLFERNELPSQIRKQVLSSNTVTVPQLPKPILKKPMRRKRVPQVKPVVSEPVTQEKRKHFSRFFKHFIKFILRSVGNIRSRNLNEMELGLEPRVLRVSQYHHVSSSPFSKLRTRGDTYRLPEDVV